MRSPNTGFEGPLSFIFCLAHRPGWRRRWLTCVAGLLSLWLALAGPAVWAQTTPGAAATDPEVPTPTAPVTLGDTTLFNIRADRSADSLAERAQRISDRVEVAARDDAIPLESLALAETEFGTAIYARDMLIMTVGDEDVAGTGLTPNALAKQHLTAMQTQMKIYRAERSAEYLTRASIIAFLCTVGMVLAIVVLANIMPQFYRWLDRQQDRWIPNLRIQNFELLSAAQLTSLVQVITRVLHFGLVFTLILVYLSYVLSLFPATRSLGQGVFGYFWGAVQGVSEGLIAYLPNLLSIAVIIVLVSSGLRFAQWIFSNIRRGRLSLPGFYPEWATPTFHLVKFLAYAFALAVIFPYLPGAESPAFQGVSIFFGLLVSVGAGGAVFSMVAGFILVYTRAFQEGDRIHVGDIEGFVVEKSLFVTRLRTIENLLVSIPNASLLTSNIANYSALIREQQIPMVVKTTITLGYDVPWQLVHKTMIAAAEATAHILPEPRPQVWQTSLDDFYVSYQLRASTTEPEVLEEIYAELHQNLQDHCNQAGIEILSPHYGALRDGNQSTIPASYLAANYQAPAWNLPSVPQASPPAQPGPERSEA